jgi:hypothetical protein
MKKKLLLTLLIFSTLSFVACTPSEKELDAEIAQKQEQLLDLKGEYTALKSEYDVLSSLTSQAKLDTAPEENKRYIMTLKIKQSHFSLNVKDHVKDSMNAIELDIAVDKEYYDSYEEGDEILSEFRSGSFVTSGKLGSWKVTLKDKRVEVIE